MRPGALALAVAASIALFAAGCGDEETTSSTPPISTSSSTAPSTTSSTTRSTTTTQPSTTTATTPPASVPTSTAESTVTAPSYDPDKPDSERNDKPPEAGSPQESFEQACEQNPESCG